MVKKIAQMLKQYCLSKSDKTSPSSPKNSYQTKLFLFLNNIVPLTALVASFTFLAYFQFSIISQITMFILIGIFAYQISYFSGKTGLVPFGRFNTFVMIPMFLIFKLTFIQTTILCIFTNICYATATDLLFDYKVGELCTISFKKVYHYQWLGLTVTALSSGLILWLLFTSFQLGSADLFAYRAQARALLIQAFHFNFLPVGIGFTYGLILSSLKINPMMVFGGILMPANLIIGLAIGAAISWFDKQAKEHLSFWSGVFAGESLWTLVSITLRIL